MITTSIAYPGDPETVAFLMFGKEFLEVFRGGKPGEMKITTYSPESFPWPESVEHRRVDGILCDLCALEIAEDEPLALTGTPSRVYCWDCHRKYHGPYLVRKGK